MGMNKSLVVIMFVVCIVFASLSLFLFDAASRYNTTVDAKYQNMFNNYAELQKFSETRQTITEGGQINPQGQDQAVYTNVIVAGKQSLQSGQLFGAMIQEVPKIFGIPSPIVIMFVSLITVLCIFSFIKMITKEDA